MTAFDPLRTFNLPPVEGALSRYERSLPRQLIQALLVSIMGKDFAQVTFPNGDVLEFRSVRVEHSIKGSAIQFIIFHTFKR